MTYNKIIQEGSRNSNLRECDWQSICLKVILYIQQNPFVKVFLDCITLHFKLGNFKSEYFSMGRERTQQGEDWLVFLKLHISYAQVNFSDCMPEMALETGN